MDRTEYNKMAQDYLRKAVELIDKATDSEQLFEGYKMGGQVLGGDAKTRQMMDTFMSAFGRKREALTTE